MSSRDLHSCSEPMRLRATGPDRPPDSPSNPVHHLVCLPNLISLVLRYEGKIGLRNTGRRLGHWGWRP